MKHSDTERSWTTIARKSYDEIDWWLVDKDFEKYGRHGKAPRIVEQVSKWFLHFQKEMWQLVFYGIVLGLFVNFTTMSLYDLVGGHEPPIGVGITWIILFSLTCLVTGFFLTRKAKIELEELFTSDKETEEAHDYVVRLGYDRETLRKELSRRKYQSRSREPTNENHRQSTET